jgi:hypothetical protein
MATKPIYRHVVKVEVLTESPENMGAHTLADIAHQIVEGDWSGVMTVARSNIKLEGKEAADALKEQGSDPAFFRLDDEGNELE